MPVRALISTLVGMKKMENLKKNFEVIKTEPLTKEEFTRIMQFKWLLYDVIDSFPQIFEFSRNNLMDLVVEVIYFNIYGVYFTF